MKGVNLPCGKPHRRRSTGECCCCFFVNPDNLTTFFASSNPFATAITAFTKYQLRNKKITKGGYSDPTIRKPSTSSPTFGRLSMLYTRIVFNMFLLKMKGKRKTCDEYCTYCCTDPVSCPPLPPLPPSPKARLVATPREGEKGAEWWPHPPGFNNPYTRQMESQEVVASPGASSRRDLDVDEEAGLVVARTGGAVESFRGFGGGGQGGQEEEDDEAWMVPSPDGGGNDRCEFLYCTRSKG